MQDFLHSLTWLAPLAAALAALVKGGFQFHVHLSARGKEVIDGDLKWGRTIET